MRAPVAFRRPRRPAAVAITCALALLTSGVAATAGADQATTPTGPTTATTPTTPTTPVATTPAALTVTFHNEQGSVGHNGRARVVVFVLGGASHAQDRLIVTLRRPGHTIRVNRAAPLDIFGATTQTIGVPIPGDAPLGRYTVSVSLRGNGVLLARAPNVPHVTVRRQHKP